VSRKPGAAVEPRASSRATNAAPETRGSRGRTGRRARGGPPRLPPGFASLVVLRAAACLLLASGCESGDATSRVVFTVYDQDVRCETAGGCVVEASGLPATGERLDVAGVTSPGASRHDPGLYLYAGGFRANGAFFELELDVPAYLGAEVRDLSASYREYVGGAPLFQSDAVGGEIQLVPLAGDGGPYAGSFDLRFLDDGRDGLRNTGDEVLRTLRFGSFTLSGREPERPTRPIAVREEDVYVDVQVRIDIELDPAWTYDADGCDDSTPEGYGEGSGCEGDTSTDPGGGAGCEGDTTGDVGGGSGCEGDASGDTGGGSGCEGDAGGGGSGFCGGSSGGGCQGDSPVSAAGPRARPRRPNRIFSAGLPFLALLATRFILRRR